MSNFDDDDSMDEDEHEEIIIISEDVREEVANAAIIDDKTDRAIDAWWGHVHAITDRFSTGGLTLIQDAYVAEGNVMKV